MERQNNCFVHRLIEQAVRLHRRNHIRKFTLAVTALAALGGIALASGSASAAPMTVGGLRTDAVITQVRMMHGDRMMMKKRMMRKQMMKRRMMTKRMMNRGM